MFYLAGRIESYRIGADWLESTVKAQNIGAKRSTYQNSPMT